MKLKIVIAVGVIAIAVIAVLSSQKTDPPPQDTSRYSVNENGVAIEGYDPVSFFNPEGPKLGSARFQTEWSGVRWNFVSEENRAIFLSAPDRYAPKYNGFCAFAISLGSPPPPGTPQNYKIIDGNLYLNTNSIANFLFGFLPDRVEKSETNWPQIGKGTM